jgi:predicted transcriptional regulator
MKQPEKTKPRTMLTINEKDLAARADANEGIRQGLEDVAKGRVRPAREALDEFRRKHGIPR